MFPLNEGTLGAGLPRIRRGVTECGCMCEQVCIKMESADEHCLLLWDDMLRLGAAGGISVSVTYVAATGPCSGLTRAA